MWRYLIAGFYAGMFTGILVVALLAKPAREAGPAGWVVECDGLTEWCDTVESAAFAATAWARSSGKLVTVRPMQPCPDEVEAY